MPTVQVWNLLAFSGGFDAITHQYGEAAFTAELHGVEREKLTSVEQGEDVFKAFVAGGFLQMTLFMAVSEADTELLFVDPGEPYKELERRATTLMEAFQTEKAGGQEDGSYH